MRTGYAGAVLLTAVSLGWCGPFGEITEMVGTARIKSAGRSQWKAARLKMRVRTRDRVETAAESRLEIECRGGGVIRISEQSRMVLPGDSAARDARVVLHEGRIWANMKAVVTKIDGFGIETPTAVTAIRGTVFRVDAGKDSTADVLVYEGKVDVGPGKSLGGTGGSQPRRQERHEVQGPTEVRGPKEVSLDAWVSIVAGRQIRIRKDGTYRTWEFDREQDKARSWVAYNLHRDAAMER